MKCVVCNEKLPSQENLCPMCTETFYEFELHSARDGGFYSVGKHNIPGMSLWSYRGVIRDLILAFKVQGMWQLGVGLIRIALQDRRLLDWIEDIDAVMPVPSSLWSRVRGRFDLAATLAWSLESRVGVPYVQPPWVLWGRWRKQALSAREDRVSPSFFNFNRDRIWDEHFILRSLAQGKRMKPLRVLIVDDVVTSAHTLTEFTDRFRNIDFRILTLASAYRQTYKRNMVPV